MTILIILLIVILGSASVASMFVTYYASLRQRLIYHLSDEEINEITSQPQSARIFFGLLLGKGLPAQVSIIDGILKINYESGETSNLTILDLKKIDDSTVSWLTVYPQSPKTLAFQNDGNVSIFFGQSLQARILFLWPGAKTARAMDKIAVAFYLRVKEIRENPTT